MPLVHRAGNLRFFIFVDDHAPHVHVFAAGGEAKILLGPPVGRPEMAWQRGMSRTSLRLSMLETMTRRAELVAAWRRIHGQEADREA
jgi:hypothetical protein